MSQWHPLVIILYLATLGLRYAFPMLLRLARLGALSGAFWTIYNYQLKHKSIFTFSIKK